MVNRLALRHKILKTVFYGLRAVERGLVNPEKLIKLATLTIDSYQNQWNVNQLIETEQDRIFCQNIAYSLPDFADVDRDILIKEFRVVIEHWLEQAI